jgi:hypothetical protein
MWAVIGVIVGFVISVVFTNFWRGFRVRCPDCDGTGLCTGRGSKIPHSCCGDCGRVYVPEFWEPDVSERYAMIGSGWVTGTLWQRIRRGGPLRRIGVQNRPEDPPALTARQKRLAEMHQDAGRDDTGAPS